MSSTNNSHQATLLALVTQVPSTLDAVRLKYQARHALITGRTCLVDEGEVLAEVIRDLTAAHETWANQYIPYGEASAYSGLGQKQLARLAKDGRVDSTGENRSRQFRRGSLPRKRHRGDSGAAPSTTSPLTPPVEAAERVAERRDSSYDPVADARRAARHLDLSTYTGGDR